MFVGSNNIILMFDIDDDKLCAGRLTAVLGINIDSAHNGDSLS